MTIYDYDKFVYPVPAGYDIPKGTPTRSVQFAPPVETFFTPLLNIPVESEAKYYLTYDITRPQVPTDPLSVIYNVAVTDQEDVFPIGLLTLHGTWALVDRAGDAYYSTPEDIVSFDTTPLKEEAGDDDE